MDTFRIRSLPPGLRLRSYAPSDFDACMRVYESNRGFTLPDEAALMADHLQNEIAYYLVVDGPDGVIGCGGLEQRADSNDASFIFGMVHRAHQKRGIGTLLALARLALVDCSEGEIEVCLDTSQKTEGFYRAIGFEPIRDSDCEAHYGLGLYYSSLRLSLSPATRAAVLNAMRDYRDSVAIEHEGLAKAL
jgi:N-acetylglutamate synthase-like GNAT family acetyltransferase